MRLVGRSLLVGATVVCLLSIGGAMLFGVWLLVPLHWLAARSSRGPFGVGGWAVLAAASVLQAGWMLTYVVTGSAWASFAVGLLAAGATATAFLRRAADRHVRAATIQT